MHKLQQLIIYVLYFCLLFYLDPVHERNYVLLDFVYWFAPLTMMIPRVTHLPSKFIPIVE